MKILFLDIDGVLNHDIWFKSPEYKNHPESWRVSMFDPACVARVNKILKETNAKLVVSSSWRDMSDLADIFKGIGLPTEFDVTPYSDVIYPDAFPIDDFFSEETDIRYWRGSEIQWYLDHNVTEDYTYCILDDDHDMLPEQLDYFVSTSNPYGLTDKLMNKAIDILNNGRTCKANSSQI